MRKVEVAEIRQSRGQSNLALLIFAVMLLTAGLIDGCMSAKKHAAFPPFSGPVQVRYKPENCVALPQPEYPPGSLICDKAKLIPLTVPAR